MMEELCPMVGEKYSGALSDDSMPVMIDIAGVGYNCTPFHDSLVNLRVCWPIET